MNRLFFITLVAIHFTCNLLGQEINDPGTVIYKKNKCGLFLSNKGDLAYKTSMILNDKGEEGTRYISWIYGVDTKDTLGNAGLMEMKFVIDTMSFKFLSWVYWSDKNRVYGFNPMSDGGTVFFIQRADHATFKTFGETPYAKDKDNVFYKGQPISGADVKSFKVIKDRRVPELAKDKNKYYFSGDPITKLELEELRKK